jgi:hypothetical protein
MEPVWLELKLTNTGDQPRLVDADILDADALTVILKKEGKEARQLVPFRQKCVQPVTKALMPGESIYGTVLASAGLNGWDVAEPGRYLIQAAAHVGEEDVVSAPFELRIAPPLSRDEEYSAGDLFTQDAARVLVLGGSRYFQKTNDVLEEILDRYPDRRIALHARVALGNPDDARIQEGVIPTGRRAGTRCRSVGSRRGGEAHRAALVEQADAAAESFGHIRYRGSRSGWRGGWRRSGPGEATKTIDSVIDADARIPGRTGRSGEVISQLKETRRKSPSKDKTRTRNERRRRRPSVVVA